MEPLSLVSLLKNDHLLPYRKFRLKDVDSVVSAIDKPRKTALTKTKPTIRKYPLRFFNDGISAYVNIFDNASIYYTSLAVEIAILLKHKRTVKKAKLANPKLKIDFRWLIDNSKLDKEERKIAHNMRLMRNCYIHYQNIIAYNAWLQKVRWPQFLKQQRLLAKNYPELLNTIDSLLDSINKEKSTETAPIRIEYLETKKEILDFINKRGEKYGGWLTMTLSNHLNHHEENDSLRVEKLIHIYGIEAFDALTCIEWGYKILKTLYFF